MKSESPHILDALAKLGIEILTNTHALIRDNLPTLGTTYRGIKKEDHTPVSRVEVAAFDSAARIVRQSGMKVRLIGESGNYGEEDDEIHLYFDEYDGTGALFADMPTSTATLAVMIRGELVWSGILHFQTGHIIEARIGEVTTYNQVKTHVSNEATFHCVPVGLSMWGGAMYDARRPALQEFLIKNRAIMTCPVSIGYMGMKVASGNWLCTAYFDTQIHDIAPVDLIVRMAGGVVTDLDGNPIDYSKPLKGMIASNGVLHNELVAQCQSYLK